MGKINVDGKILKEELNFLFNGQNYFVNIILGHTYGRRFAFFLSIQGKAIKYIINKYFLYHIYINTNTHFTSKLFLALELKFLTPKEKKAKQIYTFDMSLWQLCLCKAFFLSMEGFVK